MRAVERFVAFCPPTTVRARLARPMPWRERVTCFFGSRDVRAGDLVRREFLLRGGKAARPTRIAAAIARDPMVR
jgi:hypothetical protein